jgi:SAM pointed domain-containing ETS transcription factor
MFPEFLDDLQVLKTMSQQHKSSSPEQFAYQQHPVKEEPLYLLHQGYPPLPQPSQPSSPAGSTTSSTYTNNPSPYQQCPSPSATHKIIKHEQTIDLQEILQESRLLQESLGNGRTVAKKEPQKMASDCAVASNSSTGQSSNLIMAPEKSSAEKKPGDHQLLREVLRDMSFQRKYNLKPFDFDGLAASGFLAGTDARVKMETEEAGASSCSVAKGEEGSALMNIEPVLSLAIEHIREDISNTCNVLGIASGE